jgi:predicted nucleic-acid-binding protein
MIALDPNTLVRSIVWDDASQAKRVESLIERAVSAAGTLFVSDIVLCELVWTLGKVYGFEKPNLIKALRGLLSADVIVIQSFVEGARAPAAYEKGRGDFADYFIRETAQAAGCTHVATFNKALLKEHGFQSP